MSRFPKINKNLNSIKLTYAIHDTVSFFFISDMAKQSLSTDITKIIVAIPVLYVH